MSNIFIVAMCSNYDNDMKISVIRDVDSSMEALYKAIEQSATTTEDMIAYKEWVTDMRKDCKTAEDIITELFNGDINIGVKRYE